MDTYTYKGTQLPKRMYNAAVRRYAMMLRVKSDLLNGTLLKVSAYGKMFGCCSLSNYVIDMIAAKDSVEFDDAVEIVMYTSDKARLCNSVRAAEREQYETQAREAIERYIDAMRKLNPSMCREEIERKAEKEYQTSIKF